MYKNLCTACGDKKWDEVKRLVNDGAPVNDDYDEEAKETTPLMWAAREGASEDIIKLLLHAGSDVHAQRTDGWTALMYAAWRNKLDVVTALLEAGSNVHAQTTGGMTALMFAARNTSSDKDAIIRLLQQKSKR